MKLLKKGARTSVESPQQLGPSRAAGASAERSLQRQVKQSARTLVECPKRKRQVSDSDCSSCTRPYGNVVMIYYLFIYSFFNVDNYRKNTVYNKNSSKMLIDVNTLVKKRKQNY